MARLRCALCCPVAVCLVLGSLLAGAQGSAIPMWEFLSRSEKMSRLFNVFVKQVEGYCGESSMPDCNKALILYGMTNLAKMEDHHLDTMDPYQRGASDIIWDSMMKGSFEMPDEKRPQDFYVSNPASTGSNLLREGDDYPSDKGSSGSASNQFSDYATPPETISYRPLGPMMVRVMPDGGPVPGDGPQHYPKDEDAEEYALLRSRFLLPPHESAKKSKQSTSESTEKNVKSSGQSSQGSSDSIGQYRYMLVK